MSVEHKLKAEDLNKVLQNSMEAQFWAEVTNMLIFYYFDPKENEQSLSLPLIRIEPMRVETTATHRKIQTSIDVSYEVIINERWVRRPRWEIAEAVTHELIHIHQKTFPGMHAARYPYHNQQFVSVSDEIGLFVEPENGHHKRFATGQFAQLMERLDITLPDYTIDDLTIIPGSKLRNWWDFDRGIQTGKSTLFKYICGCSPKNNVRSGKKDLDIFCNRCEQSFRLEDSVKHK